MRLVIIGLVGLVVLLGGSVYGLNNQIDELEQEKQEQSELAGGTIEQLEKQLNEAEYCHELANSLAIDAEYMVVDLYDYGDNFSFWVSLELWLEKADVYNESCVNEFEMPMLGT